MVRDVPDSHFGSVLQAGVVPHMVESPGDIRWPGPDIGQHTSEILRDILRMDAAEISELISERVVS